MRALSLPERLDPVFAAVSEVGAPYGGVYLVGGTVRDIVLGEPSFDVDIAVEGDAIALAKALAESLGGRVRVHDKFGTAVVLYGEDERVDVVTARTETYDSPGVLPTVAPGSIEDDLFRRDFTINAMAVSLKGKDKGRLVDPFHGGDDLEAGRIRVLHDNSFIDDPTRIFRAIRYENRYGFRMGEHTAALAHDAVSEGHVHDLSGARMREELIALFEEGDVDHSIPRLAELGLEQAIHHHAAADAEAAQLTRRLRALNEHYGLGIPSWRIGLTVLGRNLPPNEIRAWLDGLKIRRRDAELIEGAISSAPRIAEELGRNGLAPADLVELAESHAPDAPLFALARTDADELSDYFERLAGIRLEITGADVADLGLGESPRVGEILAELRRRKLNGELDGRDSELAAARELVGES
ncbi:MAG: hypothetical protein ABI896_07695 [Actinomycetota bacterium]